MASDLGRWCRMLEAVKLGQVTKWLLLMAVIRVLGTGLNAAACKNAK